MALHAFVIRKAASFLPLSEDRQLSGGSRVVVGFFRGQFTCEEIDDFMAELSLSQGSPPPAGDHFHTSTTELNVFTSGVTFHRGMDIPLCIKEIMAEYSIVKLIDGSNFEQIRDQWFRSLALVHVVRLSEASF